MWHDSRFDPYTFVMDLKQSMGCLLHWKFCRGELVQTDSPPWGPGTLPSVGLSSPRYSLLWEYGDSSLGGDSGNKGHLN